MAEGYAIAKYLSEHERRACVAERYEPDRHGFLRTVDDCCPLGVALRSRDPQLPPAPGSEEVLRALGGPHEYSEPYSKWARIERAAAHFIGDWDHRRIDPADLPAIFEVQP